MKKTILFLVMAVALTTSTLFAQVPSYVPTNGLVGYWPFNGNANDESGNTNNGTVNGATLTTDRFGNPYSAYNFNGTSSYVYAGNISSLTGTSSSSTTISFWMNSTSTSGSNSDLFDLRSTNNSSIQVYNNNNGNAGQILVNNYNAPVANGFSAISPEALNINTWYHILCVVNNFNNHLTIYVNGVQKADLFTTVGLLTNPKLNIGSRFDLFNNRCCYFKGSIDDFTIWNRALTQQEITNIYNGVTYSDTCNAVSGSLTQGLVGYWPFCGNANDDSGNGNNGTVNGATLTTDRFGNTNSAYSFNGQGDFISGLTNNFLFGNNASTISGWYNTYSYPNGLQSQVIFCYGQSGNAGGRGTILGDNASEGNSTIGFSTLTSNPFDFRTSYNYSLNQWYHFIATYDGFTVKLYINGVLIGGQSLSLNTINGLFYMGKSPNNDSYFQGKLDDIGIWNRALTPQEITNLYNANQCFNLITVTDTLIINVGQLSYNNPVTYANNITIAPNPASTQININFNNITNLNGGTLKVINSLGQEVATTPITTSGTNSTMQLATWGGTGMYFVQIINPQGQIVDIKKIILQ